MAGFFESTYVKGTFLALIVVFGVAGGIKLGYYLVEPPVSAGGHYQDDSMLREALSSIPIGLKTGDQFPAEACLPSDSITIGFEQLYGTHEKTLFLFVEFGCDPCLYALEFLEYEGIFETREQSQVIICYDLGEAEVPQEYERIIGDIKTVKVDLDLFKMNYDMGIRPTMIGVDRDGTIGLVFVGFTETISYLLMDDLSKYHFLTN